MRSIGRTVRTLSYMVILTLLFTVNVSVSASSASETSALSTNGKPILQQGNGEPQIDYNKLKIEHDQLMARCEVGVGKEQDICHQNAEVLRRRIGAASSQDKTALPQHSALPSSQAWTKYDPKAS